MKAIAHMDAEVIVADNHSEDESLSLLARFFPTVQKVSLQQNLGFSKGNNQAIAQAKGKYICLLNPDTVVPENCFEEVLAFAKTVPNAGAIGVQLVDGKGQFLAESKRNIPTPRMAIAKLAGFSNSYYAHQLPADGVGKVDVLVGAFMCMQKDRYFEVGGLDEAYFMYGEDIDLSVQFLNHGYQNYYLGSTRCIHFKGESTTKDSKFKNRFFGAMQIFYKKHFKSSGFNFFLVNAGLSLAKQLNIGLPVSKIEEVKFENNWLVSDNAEVLKKLSFISSIQLISKEELALQKNGKALVIFDAAYLSYIEIIHTLCHPFLAHCRFRIIPSHHHVMIGSDASTRQGEAVFL